MAILLSMCSSTISAERFTAKGAECGTERWPIKVMSDPDRTKIDFQPRSASIADLGAIPIPEVPYPNNRRLAPEELSVYRVRAIVAQILEETDGDWHLVLRDPANAASLMIAEIPSPQCASTVDDAALYAEARRVLRTVPRQGVVEIVGVGFFDFIHSQRGRAPNGIELHPVLSLRKLQ